VAILASAGLLVLGYSFLKRLKDPVIPAIKAIPDNAVCVIRFNNLMPLWDRLEGKNNIWKELQCLPYIKSLRKEVKRVDSLARKNNDIAEIFSKNPLYMSWVPDRADYRLLYCINLNGPHRENLVDNFMHNNFSKGNTFVTHQFLDNEIFEIHKAGKILCAYTVCKGIFIIGETSGLVEASLSAILTGISIENDPDFSRLDASSGKNVDANIFLKNSYFDNLVSPFFEDLLSQKLKMLSLSGDMISLDLTVKNDELLFDGYATSHESSQLLTKLFSDQPPQKITLTQICPANTAIMAFWGVKNALNYIRNYTDFINVNFHRRSFQDMCSYYDTTYNIDISKSFFKNIGNQFACIITENPNLGSSYRYYGVFKAGDIDDLSNGLKAISVLPGDQSIAQRDSFAIRKLIPAGFLQDFFGRMFESLDSTYYTTIEDYVIISDSPLSLDLFISGYLSGKTLEKNLNYIDFSDNVSDEATYCVYANIRKSYDLLTHLFNSKINSELSINRTSLINLQAVAFQLSSNRNRYYINAYVKHNSGYVEENPAVWEFNADTTISGKISVIADPRDSIRKILFFDVSGNLYMINRNGRLVWKKHIDEPPLSRVFLTSLKKDNKDYLIFNTANYIYIFDLAGKMPDFSPVRLPFPASASITLIHYQRNDDYRIIIPGKNQKLYNYMINGMPTPGWSNYHTEAILKNPVEYFRFRDKDILIATDKNGKVYFINRKGTLLIRTTQPFIRAKNSRFFMHTLQKKQYLVTTDRKGKLVFISENGKIDIVTLNTFSEDHYFTVGDFDLDNRDDFIFFDKGYVYIYNHDKKKIFESALSGQPSASPLYMMNGKNKYYIVFPNAQCSNLVLLNEKGCREYQNFILSTPCIETDYLFGNHIPSVIVSDSNKLLNYVIE